MNSLLCVCVRDERISLDSRQIELRHCVEAQPHKTRNTVLQNNESDVLGCRLNEVCMAMFHPLTEKFSNLEPRA